MADIQVFNWKVQGGPAYLAPGILIDGDYDTENEELESAGIGGQGSLRGGILGFPRSINVDVTKDTKTLIQAALRPSQTSKVSDMSLIDAAFGDDVKAWNDFLWIDEHTCELEESGILKATFGFIRAPKDSKSAGVPAGGIPTTIAVPAQVAITGDSYTYEDSVLTIDGGSTMRPLMVSYKLGNQFALKSDIAAKTAGQKRAPTIIHMGLEELEVEFGCDARYKDEIESAADDLVPVASVLVATQGANTITWTFSNLKLTRGPGVPFTTGAGEIIYKYTAKKVVNKTGLVVT